MHAAHFRSMVAWQEVHAFVSSIVEYTQYCEGQIILKFEPANRQILEANQWMVHLYTRKCTVAKEIWMLDQASFQLGNT